MALYCAVGVLACWCMMLLRTAASACNTGTVRMAQLEEVRHQEARRALERDSRNLWRRFGPLERGQRTLRVDHDFQRERVDLLTTQLNAVLALVTADVRKGQSGLPLPQADRSSSRVSGVAEAWATSAPCEATPECDAGPAHLAAAQLVIALRTEKECYEKECARLLRRNAELELQVSTVMTQFGRLVTDFESVCVAHDQLKAAVASASSVEDLVEWVSL